MHLHPPTSGETSLPELSVRLPWRRRNRRVAENLVFGLFAVGATIWTLHQASHAHRARHARDGTACERGP